MSTLTTLGKAPGAHCFAQLLFGEEAGGNRLAIAELCGAIAALGIQKIEQADSAPLVRVFADIAVFLRPFEITRTVELQDPVGRLETFVGISYVGQDLIVRRLLLLLRLRNDVMGAGDLALVTIMNGKRNTHIK